MMQTDSGPNDMARPQGKASLSKSRHQAKELFKEADVNMNWSTAPKVGSGLYNLGNTCFMNSVLQCLMHTPPLAKLLASSHSLVANAAHEGFDPIKQTRELLHDSVTSRRGYVEPRAHAKTMRKINRSFRLGRQEDAHEYLIALLDAMHDRSIAGVNPKPPPDVEMTSFIYRIFGGKIRSQVKCTQCSYESNTYDPFLDLSLEITHANSVEKALHRFTAGEALDGSNKYKCPKQNKPVRAIKRMTVEVAPNVLVVQLKRFEFSFSGRKISKAVEFHETLDLGPFMSSRPTVPVQYDLYGVLVHAGHSMHSGHYYCYIKNALKGDWHKYDDTRVSPTSVRNVLGQQAYILFYMRRQPKAIIDRPMPRAAAAEAVAIKPSVKKLAAIEKQDLLAAAHKMATAAPAPPAAAKNKTGVAAAANAAELRMANGVSGKKRREPEPESSSPSSSEDEEEESEEEDRAQRTVSAKKGRYAKEAVKVAASLLRPRPGSAIGSKRVKRLEETRHLHFAVALKMSQIHGSPSPVRKRRKAVSAVKADVQVTEVPQLRTSARRLLAAKAAAEAAAAATTPDWPPLPAQEDDTDDLTVDAAPNKTPAGKTSGKSAAAVRVKGKAAAREISRGAVGAVEGWDGELGGSGVLRHAADKPARRTVDEYDLEYDRGKTKKVRTKASGGTLESRDFDAMYSSKARQQQQQQRGGSGGGRGKPKRKLGSIRPKRQSGGRGRMR